MKKTLLALCAIVIMSSFSKDRNDTVILKEIDGTLLKSFPVIQKVDGDYQITFTVDANTVVSTVVENNQTHVYLIENGSSNATAKHTLSFKTTGIDFTNYFETGADIASLDGNYAVSKRLRKPKWWIPEFLEF
ncbi:hypothetical protein MWU59_03710 [Flavobacteriaceae bacterium F08102]|nr:hypothetical protein [Flavobacteriaceae bacterium F08102]